MLAPGDIFQAKLNKILDNIEGIKTYLDSILFLIKESFFEHID